MSAVVTATTVRTRPARFIEGFEMSPAALDWDTRTFTSDVWVPLVDKTCDTVVLADQVSTRFDGTLVGSFMTLNALHRVGAARMTDEGNLVWA
jgi:hypothetical protein